MNEMTRFLLQLIGPIGLVVAVSFLFTPKLYEKMIKQMSEDALGIYLSALAALSIGMAMVLKHNLWGSFPEVVITLFGWLSLVKGVILVFSPSTSIGIAKKMWRGGGAMIAMMIWLVLGVYMTYAGFWG